MEKNLIIMHIVLNTFYLSPGGRGETWACLFRQQQLLFLDGVYIDGANKEKQRYSASLRADATMGIECAISITFSLC
jgi:hypothetical protein